ncbi:uncharacterized protein HaLaN_09927, partial [Haematococcus lacustris]
MTSMAFILAVGVFFSSWLGSVLLGVGEWLIKRLPLVRHIYSASKQAPHGDTRLVTVYVPTNHVYVGDVFLLEEADVIHTNLSVREGLEIVIS